MSEHDGGDGFTGGYVPDDERLRRDFDLRLARYIRGHPDRWNIAALLDALDLLGDYTEGDVRLRRCRPGELSVTLTFELPLIRVRCSPARRGSPAPFG